MINQIQQALQFYETAYDAFAEDLAEEILWQIGQELPVTRAVEVSLGITGFEENVREEAELALLIALALGLGLSRSRTLPLPVRNTLTEKLATISWTTDKKAVRNRLKEMPLHKTLTQAITSSFKRGENVAQIARDLRGVLTDVEALSELLEVLLFEARRVVEGDNTSIKPLRKAIQELKRQARKEDSENTKQHYERMLVVLDFFIHATRVASVTRAVQVKAKHAYDRIVKTETARAWYEGFILQIQENDDVWGMKYTLSHRHNVYDICDVLANTDIGYGKGVYPKDQAPQLPRHPFCMCTLKPVKKHPNVENPVPVTTAIETYLRGLNDVQRRKLLGVDGAKAFKENGEWKNHLRGWDGFPKITTRISLDDLKGI